eukprot:scaffold66785_cov37-Phaeocystis_antarctica.AAC.2
MPHLCRNSLQMVRTRQLTRTRTRAHIRQHTGHAHTHAPAHGGRAPAPSADLLPPLALTPDPNPKQATPDDAPEDPRSKAQQRFGGAMRM